MHGQRPEFYLLLLYIYFFPQAVWEAEELRNSTRAMEARLKVAESKALSEASKRAEAERQLVSAQQKIEELEELAAEAATVPTLRADLAKAESLIGSLTETRDSLQVAARTFNLSLWLINRVVDSRTGTGHRSMIRLEQGKYT